MTTIMARPIWFGLALIVAAFVATLAISANNTSALSQSQYITILERNGYNVTVGDAVDHPTLSIDGRILIVELNGRKAAVEILDYGTQAKLKADFEAVDGEGPTPIKAARDFDAKVLYWFNDSVLAVDYNAPNDPVIARAAANSYLGLPGEGGEEPGQPASPTASPAPGSPTRSPGGLPPSGGPPDASSDDGNAMALGLALIAAGGLAAAVVLVRQRRTNS